MEGASACFCEHGGEREFGGLGDAYGHLESALAEHLSKRVRHAIGPHKLFLRQKIVDPCPRFEENICSLGLIMATGETEGGE
mmetsp:Transcript_34533/g.68278  ORF Transcript_34533/g.68278 Transcript_34533/m.68278 type:complete len:82 (+) Transcript_34533:383-628(+)